LQTNDLKSLDISFESTLTRPSHDSTLTRLENFLHDSDSSLVIAWLELQFLVTRLV